MKDINGCLAKQAVLKHTRTGQRQACLQSIGYLLYNNVTICFGDHFNSVPRRLKWSYKLPGATP
jgi:hypothetical protein